MKKWWFVICVILVALTACETTTALSPPGEPSTVTVVPPTVTSSPPTATIAPPTFTAVPPTATSVPPTATSVPPTATARPTIVSPLATPTLYPLLPVTGSRITPVPDAIPEVPSLATALGQLAGGVGLGFVLAFLFEPLPWFQALSAERKEQVVFAITVGLPLIATTLLQFVPAGVWAAIEPYWQALARGFLAWGGSQAAHAAFIKGRGEVDDEPTA